MPLMVNTLFCRGDWDKFNIYTLHGFNGKRCVLKAVHTV